MNENENDFEALRRLLAWKRHETPPPGYFENLSSEVMSRIRIGEGGRRTMSEQFAEELPWMFRLLQMFEAKPAFAGAFASTICMLMLAGIFVAERPAATPQPLLPSGQIAWMPAAAAPSDSSPKPEAQPGILSLSSTNPVFNARSVGNTEAVALFGGQNAFTQPAVLTVPAN